MGNQKKLLFLLLLAPITVWAKEGTGKIEGVLHGYVTDAVTKKPLCGVTVLAFIPGTNSSKEVQTDSEGYFFISQLPATQVTVTFDKKGYQTTRRPNVSIREKTSVRLNVEFLPEDISSNSDRSDYPILRLLEAS
ncbi:MAG: carboxypeptidase regulatory-like domain-containing protein [Bacteroidetes bacterium]|nr:carboxypeptidase regulatory-like domain-containing protein [Bacteroidota bacterium]